MPRPTGKTLFTVGLLTIPMRIYPATKEHDHRFHLHHDRCLTRISQQRVCPACNIPVSHDHLLRGVEGPAGPVTFTDEELDALPLPSAGAIHVEGFLPGEAPVPAERRQRLQYLGPGEGGARAFTLLHHVLTGTSRVAVGKMANRGNEEVVVVSPGPDGCLYLWTLWYPDEIKPTADIAAHDCRDITLKPQEIALGEQLVGGFVLTTDGLDALADESEAALQALIEQKAAGQVVAAPTRPDVAPPDLMDTLRRMMAEAGVQT